VNGRKLVFSVLAVNFLVSLFGFMQMFNSKVADALVMAASLQILGSFCVVCLSYWVATDREKR